MKITIYNYTPKSIMKLLEKIDQLHHHHSMTPITLNFEFCDITEPDENNEFEFYNYDYFETKAKHAEITLDDASLEFDNIKLGKKYIFLNDKLYKYRQYRTTKCKNDL